MKIEIEVTNYQLSFLNELIVNNLPDSITNHEKQAKSLFYLITDVSKKTFKKAIDKKGISKPFKLSLKYWEAYALHQFILTFMDYEPSENKRITREILANINQKLA